MSKGNFRENNLYAIGKAWLAANIELGKPMAETDRPPCLHCGQVPDWYCNCPKCNGRLCSLCQLRFRFCPACLGQ